jgi:hypothetical protein
MYLECVSPRLLATLILGAALAAGCGQASAKSPTGPAPKQDQGLIAESAAATEDAGTARAAYTMTMSGLPQVGELKASGDGLVDFKNRTSQLALHMSYPQAGMTVDISERMIGAVIYMHSPLLAGAGKPWIKLDLQRFGKAQGLDLNATMSASSSDPAQMLTYLDAASDSIDRVGTQDVRGVATTRYHVVLDLFKVAARAPSDERAAVRRTFAREAKLLGGHTMPIDVWIDSSGLVRREHIQIPLKAPSIPAGASMAMTIDLFEFGVPVHVKAPPASDVTDLADVVPPAPSA